MNTFGLHIVEDKNMKTFAVMSEGREAGQGYIVSIGVVANHGEEAKRIALEAATRIGLKIIGVEDIEEKTDVVGAASSPGVARVYGKAYFELE